MSHTSSATTSRSKPIFATAPAAFFTSTSHPTQPPPTADAASHVDEELHALHIRVSPQPWEGGDDADEDEGDLPDSPLTFHSDPADDDEEKTPPSLTAAPQPPLVTLLKPTQPTLIASTDSTPTQLPLSTAPSSTHLSSSSSSSSATSSSSSSPSLSHCKVVGCVASASVDGYCAPHRFVFAPVKAAVESDANKDKRERREKKSREAHLAALRERGSSSLPPTSPPLPATSSSSTPSPSWFSRPRKASGSAAEYKADDDERPEPVDALLTETRKAWKQANSVVSKDVPRLAKRMSVIDDKRICVLWGRRVGEEEVSRATKPRPSISHSHSASNHDGGAREERGADEEPARLSSAGASFPLPPHPLIAPDAQSSAALPPDPPSPKSRVTGKEVVESELVDISTWSAVTNVVLAVAEHLETPAVVQRLRDAFASSALVMSPQSDLELALSSLFTAELGAASPTFAGYPLARCHNLVEDIASSPLSPLLVASAASLFVVFRACHQSILFPAVYHLKTNLYASVGQMKDVRRHDGWTVEIYVGDGRVWITHLRTEQSLEPEQDPAHFECQWEIRLSFDRQMLDCRAVFLRILQLNFHPNVQRERRAHIIDVLRGNGYII